MASLGWKGLNNLSRLIIQQYFRVKNGAQGLKKALFFETLTMYFGLTVCCLNGVRLNCILGLPCNPAHQPRMMSRGHQTNPRLSRTIVQQAKYMMFSRPESTHTVRSLWHIPTTFKFLEDFFIFLHIYKTHSLTFSIVHQYRKKQNSFETF